MDNFLWFIVIVALVIIYLIFTFNKLVKSRNKVDEAMSGIDAYLQERLDSLMGQAEIVKSAANHESAILSEVTQLRKSGFKPQTTEEKVALLNKLQEAQAYINALSESYPDLKSIEGFRDLQTSNRVIEEKISASRRAYNAEVNRFNNMVMTFPNNFVIKVFGNRFDKMELLKADEEAKTRPNLRATLGL